MSEAVFTLDRLAKRELERGDGGEIVLEKRPPKQWEHLAGINDIRIAAERIDGLTFFFAAWELPAIGWKFSMVPDAVFRVADHTFAVEYDRGLEGLRYFVGSKIGWYRQGLPGFPLAAVLVIADGEARLQTLTRAIADNGDGFAFATIEAIRRLGIPESIRSRCTCSREASCREDRFLSGDSGGSIA